MNILALDTSTQALTVAATQQDGLIYETNFFGAWKHSENLIHSIDHALYSVELKLEDIELLAVGLGPGSFTGLRIGLATLKGLNLILNKPCLGVSSLDIIAENFSFLPGQGAVIVDARREKLYASFYSVKDNQIVKTSKDLVLSLPEFIKACPENIVLTGDGISTYGKEIKRALDKRVCFLDELFWYPRASHLVKMARRSKDKKFLCLEEILPLYLRQPEAKEKIGKK